MKKIVCFFIYSIFLLNLKGEEFVLRFEDNNILMLTGGEKLRVARLWPMNGQGEVAGPSVEAYIVREFLASHPVIEDKISGHHLRIELINCNGGRFIAIYYFSGGNQYVLKLYSWMNNNDIIALSHQPNASNMRDIVFRGDQIIVKNQEYSNSKRGRIVCTDIYRLEGNDCKFVSSSKSEK